MYIQNLITHTVKIHNTIDSIYTIIVVLSFFSLIILSILYYTHSCPFFYKPLVVTILSYNIEMLPYFLYCKSPTASYTDRISNYWYFAHAVSYEGILLYSSKYYTRFKTVRLFVSNTNTNVMVPLWAIVASHHLLAQLSNFLFAHMASGFVCFGCRLCVLNHHCRRGSCTSQGRLGQ